MPHVIYKKAANSVHLLHLGVIRARYLDAQLASCIILQICCVVRKHR